VVVGQGGGFLKLTLTDSRVICSGHLSVEGFRVDLIDKGGVVGVGYRNI